MKVGSLPETLNGKSKLDQQMGYLSLEEQELMTCLAVQAKPVSVSELRSQIKSQISAKTMLEILESLSARSLLSQSNGSFSLDPMLRDYVKIFIDSDL